MFRSIGTLRPLMTIALLIFAWSWDAPASFAGETRIQDPTRPPASIERGGDKAGFSPFQSWNLSSTLISPSRSIAIINGQIFKEGEILDGAEVVAIQPGAVEIRQGGASHWLHATSGIEKKSPPAGRNLP